MEKRKTAFYADGAKAWKTAADSLNTKCFQVSHQMGQYCKDIYDLEIGRLPKKAGTMLGCRLEKPKDMVAKANEKKEESRRQFHGQPTLGTEVLPMVLAPQCGFSSAKPILERIGKAVFQKRPLRWKKYEKIVILDAGILDHFSLICMKVVIPMRIMSVSTNLTGPPVGLFPCSFTIFPFVEQILERISQYSVTGALMKPSKWSKWSAWSPYTLVSAPEVRLP